MDENEAADQQRATDFLQAAINSFDDKFPGGLETATRDKLNKWIFHVTILFFGAFEPRTAMEEQGKTRLEDSDFHLNGLHAFCTNIRVAKTIVDIWTAFNTLLQHRVTQPDNSETPATPIRPNQVQSKSNQTPYSYSIGSTSYNRQLVADIERIIKVELDYNFYPDIERFIPTFFHSVPSLLELSINITNHLHIKNQSLFPSDTTEESKVKAWFFEIVRDITRLARKLAREPSVERRIQSRSTCSFSKSFLRGVVGDLSPDLVFSEGQEPTGWENVIVVGELKSNSNMDGKASALQLARYAHALFQTNPHQRFVHGFTICADRLRLYLFDRGVVLSSLVYDLRKDLSVFVQMVLGYLMMTPGRLGKDSSVGESDGKAFIRANIDGRETSIRLGRLLYHEMHLFGRATTCWKGTFRAKDGKETTCVIKDSWIYKESNEGDLYAVLRNGAVAAPNVGICLDSEIVKIDGDIDDLHTCVRRSIGLQVSEKARVPAQKPNGYQYTTKIITATEDDAEDDGLETCTIPPYNRLHRRFVLSPLGSNIVVRMPNKRGRLTITLTNDQLINAFHGAIQGHQQLYHNGILHRDISVNNILFDKTNNRGFIIDLDHAIRVPRLSIPDESEETKGKKKHTRTGTKLFMSATILLNEQVEHRVYHDLESFFWVLFWLCLGHTDGLEDWSFQKDPVNLGCIKSSLLNPRDMEHQQGWTRQMARIRNANVPEKIVECLVKLRLVLFDAKDLQWIDTGDLHYWDEVYKEVLAVFA